MKQQIPLKAEPIWNPITDGLSVSGLELWLINRVAFELKYLQNLVPVEEWNKNIGYGQMFQCCIEGFIKTNTVTGSHKLLEIKTKEFLIKYPANHDDIVYYATLAEKQFNIFLELYSKELIKTKFTDSEKYHKVTIELPSGRDISLIGYIDGENDTMIMENKTRAEWDINAIIEEIDLNLQYNYYCMIFYAEHDNTLPKSVWYQHIRRPGGFAYRGPKQKKLESKEEYLYRLTEYISTNKEDHFYRFMSKPTKDRFYKFLYICLYPILEAFLDWYEYMIFQITPNNSSVTVTPEEEANKYHWLTPYGLYNPYVQGTEETFRKYALTGSKAGLVKRVKHH